MRSERMQFICIKVREGETLKRIDGVWFRCYDTGSSSFEGARANRKRQFSKAYDKFYKEYEASLDNLEPLPEGMSLGSVPSSGKRGRSPNLKIFLPLSLLWFPSLR